MKIFLILAILLVGFVFSATAQHDHEYAPLKEQKIKYKDWTYKNVRTDEDVNLREFAKDKKLVMVFYFAPWCHSSKYEMPILQELYEKYKDKGFGVVGVTLYASLERVNKELDDKKVTFPVVVESTSKFDREESLHYKYRTKTGDNRKWGTPWNIFIEPSQMKKKGDTLVKKAFVVNGEFILEETEKHIREKLGLPPEENDSNKIQATKNVEIETCEEDETLGLEDPS